MNGKVPFEESDATETQVSLYAATKKANEAIAHSYAAVHHLPVTGLRFFTVYGPWGRPDMALFKFTRNILEGKEIDVYNNGNLRRDFTYVDDIVEGIFRLVNLPPEEELPYVIYNIGHGKPVELTRFIKALEGELAKKAVLKMLPMQPGDVEQTWADVTKLGQKIKIKPTWEVEDGIREFVSWYLNHYRVAR